MNQYYSSERIIDWDKVLLEIKGIKGRTTVIEDSLDEFYNPRIIDFDQHNFEPLPPSTYWVEPGYNFKNIYFGALEAGEHFSKDVETKFGEHFRVIPLYSWISIVYPGYSVPVHVDEEPNEKMWKEQGLNLVRYSTFMQDPIEHQIFIIGDDYYFNTPKHTVVKWYDLSLFHAAVNCSQRLNYLYHFIGFKE